MRGCQFLKIQMCMIGWLEFSYHGKKSFWMSMNSDICWIFVLKNLWDFDTTEMNYWCSSETIRCWVTSWPGYKLYCERIVQYPTREQQTLHYDFAQKFYNNWRLGPGKYLPVLFDEKWFWSIVTRNTAKSFDGAAVSIKTKLRLILNLISQSYCRCFSAAVNEADLLC